jgi:hypothetical protein
MSELNEILGKYIFDTARENNDSIDASNNPYSLFFNNKCIHPILVEQYNVRAGG